MTRRRTLITLGAAAFAAAILLAGCGSSGAPGAGSGMGDMAGMEGMDHSGHGATGGSDAGSGMGDMPGMEGMDHTGHGASVSVPQRPRALVLGGFVAVNALVLITAALMRRRNGPQRPRRSPAGVAATPTV